MQLDPANTSSKSADIMLSFVSRRHWWNTAGGRGLSFWFQCICFISLLQHTWFLQHPVLAAQELLQNLVSTIQVTFLVYRFHCKWQPAAPSSQQHLAASSFPWHLFRQLCSKVSPARCILQSFLSLEFPTLCLQTFLSFNSHHKITFPKSFLILLVRVHCLLFWMATALYLWLFHVCSLSILCHTYLCSYLIDHSKNWEFSRIIWKWLAPTKYWLMNESVNLESCCVSAIKE